MKVRMLFPLQNSGIDRLIPDMMIDDFQFDPCGYSMNGLMRSVPVSKLFDWIFVWTLNTSIWYRNHSKSELTCYLNDVSVECSAAFIMKQQ